MGHRRTYGRKRDDESHVFMCDDMGCGEEAEYPGEWEDAWSAAKRDGWRAFKDQLGEWCHTCPNCVQGE